jgi:hypothetical protein
MRDLWLLEIMVRLHPGSSKTMNNSQHRARPTSQHTRTSHNAAQKLTSWYGEQVIRKMGLVLGSMIDPLDIRRVKYPILQRGYIPNKPGQRKQG